MASSFSRSEKKMLGAWFAAMAWAFTAPVTVPDNYANGDPDDGVLDSLIRRQQGDVVIERVVNLMRLLREERKEVEGLVTQAELEKAYARMLKRLKVDGYRLTNREVCLLMMGASLKAPLNRWAYAEYYRAFVSSYGLVQVRALFGQEPPLVEWDYLHELRYFDSKLRDRFPLVTQEDVIALNNLLRPT